MMKYINRKNRLDIECPAKQSGVVLVVSLVILLLMTLIGVQSISSTSLEEKMAGNYQNSQLSFQAAEAALREAEELVLNTQFDWVDYSADCTSGLCFDGTFNDCPVVNPATPHWLDFANVWDGSKHRNYTGSLAGVAIQPKYIIEFRCCAATDLDAPAPDPATMCASNDWSEIYRITALGYGGTEQARTMLQSIYKKDIDF